ncbi:hypothetical protein [Halorarum halobium]|uniref:hypothetical protein n=1 Tax=Halorarum halobium TaxID=3075121 RepID=UPI0028AE5BFF|nr:hypothetical protein [Halobaculum sp. XH14]
MPSDALAARLNVIVALLAGILGVLLFEVLSTEGAVGLLAAVAVGSMLAYLAVVTANDHG